LDILCRFFFFQAEDGIRDRNVTGVQTCALPILKTQELLDSFLLLSARRASSWHGVRNTCFPPQFHYHLKNKNIVPTHLGLPSPRSEERRVGKESSSL